MKKDIHPQYFDNATITCACGNSFNVGSTQEKNRVELCNECHPFYTGKQKFVDTARRVEKFQEKLKLVKDAANTRKGKKAKRAAKAKKKDDAEKPAKKEKKPKADSPTATSTEEIKKEDKKEESK